MIKYTQYHKISPDYVKTKITGFLAEDIPNGDKTTIGTTPEINTSVAQIQAVTEMVFAGAQIIPYCFGDQCDIKMDITDGECITSGTVIGSISGPSGIILSRERVMLNIIQRLCGIATLTRTYVALAKPKGVIILDTRKTTPGLRLFEKYAVAVGGGQNHRLNLSDGILIKDNHLKAAGGVENAISGIKKADFALPVELEVDNFDQIREGLDAGVDGFLLDNMDPKTTAGAVKIIRSHPHGEEIFIESSGGITLENMDGYLDTGINAISVGALTHGAKSMDIRMEFID